MADPAPRLLHDESGFTLPELLISMILMLVVGFATLAAAQTAERTTKLGGGRQQAAADARAVLQRMTRDVREATQILVSSSQVMDLTVPVRGTNATVTAHVQWDCASVAQRCVRLKCTLPLGSGCTAASRGPELRGVTNVDVFTPRNGQTKLTFPAAVSASNLGVGSIDFVEMHLRIRVDQKTSGPQSSAGATHPTDVYDGADVAQYQN
jgi:prepilin-type N-terminal cleavage/methylation domain-containing protein